MGRRPPRHSMISALETLRDLGADGAPTFWRRALSRIGLGVAAEWAILYAVLRGLSAQRSGESTVAPLLLFLGSLWILHWANHQSSLMMRSRFTEVARRSIAAIAGGLHRLPLLEFERLDRRPLMTLLVGDGGRVAAAGRPLLGLATGLIRTLVALAFILWLSAAVAVVATGVGLLLVAVMVGRRVLMSEDFAQAAQGESRLYEVLRDQHQGAPALRLHSARAEELSARFRELSARLKHTRVDVWSRYLGGLYAYHALLLGLLGVNAFVLPLFVDIGGESVRETNLALLFLLFALVSVVFSAPKVADSAQAAVRLDEFCERLQEEHLEAATVGVSQGRLANFDHLVMDGLTFAFPARGGRAGFGVGPIHAELRRGELVFVTGPSGSGKSTFLKMLCGLYPPNTGTLCVDGEALDPAELPDFRALFGTNFADHDVVDRVVAEAGGEARAAVLLEEMGLADKTSIEGGRISARALSTGQRERLAMVVARLRDRPILLFDEATAAQDPELRAFFYDTLLPRLRDAGKLVLVVTHDEQHFGLADRLLRLEDGRVVADTVTPKGA